MSYLCIMTFYANMMSVSLLTVRIQIFLNSPKDWDEWILLLKHAALEDNI